MPPCLCYMLLITKQTEHRKAQHKDRLGGQKHDAKLNLGHGSYPAGHIVQSEKIKTGLK